jgi:hypothetical protein
MEGQILENVFKGHGHGLGGLDVHTVLFSWFSTTPSCLSLFSPRTYSKRCVRVRKERRFIRLEQSRNEIGVKSKGGKIQFLVLTPVLLILLPQRHRVFQNARRALGGYGLMAWQWAYIHVE